LPAAAAAYEVIFVPGFLYKRFPMTGADLAAPRAALKKIGLSHSFVETVEDGVIEANAEIVMSAIRAGARSGRRMILVSVSKSGPEVALALTRLEPEETVSVAAWINVAGTLQGSPLADDESFQIENYTGKIDMADLQKRIDANTRIIYVTQYFGFPQPIEPIREICDERGIYLVEDCALSLLSTGNNNRKMGSTGDISIFNLYKTLPLPDGGAMIINNPALIHDPPVMFASPQARVTMEFIKLFQHFVFHKIPLANAFYAGIRNLKNKNNTRREVRDNIRHNFSDMLASYYYDENLSLRRMSFLSKYMLNRYDYNRVVHNRRRNFKKYLHDLRDTETMHFLYPDLPEGICPLYFPILVDNPGYICKQLYRYSIFTYHWWSGYHKDLPWSDFPEACYLKDHLLALPVHQQLQETKIDYIIQKLLKVMRESQY